MDSPAWATTLPAWPRRSSAARQRSVCRTISQLSRARAPNVSPSMITTATGCLAPASSSNVASALRDWDSHAEWAPLDRRRFRFDLVGERGEIVLGDDHDEAGRGRRRRRSGRRRCGRRLGRSSRQRPLRLADAVSSAAPAGLSSSSGSVADASAAAMSSGPTVVGIAAGSSGLVSRSSGDVAAGCCSSAAVPSSSPPRVAMTAPATTTTAAAAAAPSPCIQRRRRRWASGTMFVGAGTSARSIRPGRHGDRRVLLVEHRERGGDRGLAGLRGGGCDVVERAAQRALAIDLGHQLGVGRHDGALVFGRHTVDVGGDEFELFVRHAADGFMVVMADRRNDPWNADRDFDVRRDRRGSPVVARAGSGPRAMRDLTVPTGIPSTSAISP